MTSSELKKLRIKEGLKQSDIALILGIKQSYVSDMEQNKKPISKEVIKKLNNHFGLTYSETEHQQTFVSEPFQQNIAPTNIETAFDIMRKQADSLATKDEQINRLITLLENQLNK
ncbi:MAG: helix-turn-helix transcriptional regulator [Paludibacter sp.]